MILPLTAKEVMLTSNQLVPTPFIVVFPGAGHPSRRWGTEKFKLLISKLTENFQIVITGGPDDVLFARELADDNAINLAGVLKLPELYPLLKRAALLISNETGITHMAAQLKVQTVCISNGNNFGRFHPYPKEICETISYVYPKEISRNLSDRVMLTETYGMGSDLDINSITVEEVFEAFKSKQLDKYEL